ncbi:hypothetical protein BBP40_004057 [Aspergillus hancockii]|nr:hypothetical protein BBP40_004057 [Aspergillus hancockii]
MITSTSAISSTTRATRTNLGLPTVTLDTRQADPQLKETLREPTELRGIIMASIKAHHQTENITIEGAKSAPRHTVKIFVDKEENTTRLREYREWLEALPGVRLRGEQWFPVKIDDVRKSDVFDDNGCLHDDFPSTFDQEN